MSGRVGVVLLNLGGPSSIEEIRPFLLALFRDREIIRLGPRWLQPLIARAIVRKRLPQVVENYERIGGGSPLLALTRRQAEGLEARLRARGIDARVGVAMRYTAPASEDALEELGDADRLLALTLCPQYSKATTGSSLAELRRAMERRGDDRPLAVVDRYPEHPGYLDALAARIRAGLEGYPAGDRAEVVLLFSAHSLPKRFVDEGDPYVEEIERTVAGVRARLPAGQPFRLAFQSRAGPVAWVGPDTRDVIADLAREGRRNVLTVPVAFVSDHIETLEEIDHQYAGLARSLGIDGFRRVESLNDLPAFLDALADLAEEAIR